MAEIGTKRIAGTRYIDPTIEGTGVRAVIRDEHGTELWACPHAHQKASPAFRCAEEAIADAGWTGEATVVHETESML